MKKLIPYIILIVILVLIGLLIGYTLIFNRNFPSKEFNIQKGDTFEFSKYNVSVNIVNVSSLTCKKENCNLPEEIEVSMIVNYNDKQTRYTLKTISNPKERIKDSNFYLVLSNEENVLKIDVKDRHDV